MQRETQEIITPIGKNKVVLNQYITGKEKRSLRNIYFRTDINDTEKFNSSQDEAVRMVVVSIDGKSDNVVDGVLSLNVKDNKFVMDAIDAVTSDKITSEKKT